MRSGNYVKPGTYRYLWVVRHAKSSWDEPKLADIDRPLNPRGMRDAPFMARRIIDYGCPLPECVLQSPAVRTKQTGKHICEAIDPLPLVVENESLYLASSRVWVDAVRNTPASYSSLALIGHNPGLTELVNWIDEELGWTENLPTCAIVVYGLPRNWAAIGAESCKRLIFDFPRLHFPKPTSGPH